MTETAVLNPPFAGRPARDGSQLAEAVILLAAGLAIIVWLVSGAFCWKGYPVDHAWGVPVTAILGALAITVFAGISRLAIGSQAGGLRSVIIALVGWAASRLTLASVVTVISDEAYHWMWAKHLDLGYYDHPGMVAWMGRLFAPLHGEPSAILRLSPVFLSCGIVLLVYVLAKMLTGSARVAARSALVLMLIPTFGLGFMLLVPSVSLNVFWLVSLIFVWRATQQNRLVDWLVAGFACGCSFDANFTTFALPTCVFAYLLVTPRTRRLLATPGPYLAMLAMVIAFIPTLIWNAQHEWATILWNLLRRHDPTRFRPDALTIYLGELLLFVSPLLMVLMIWGGAKLARKGWQQKDEPILFLAVMGFGPLLIWLGLSCIRLIVAYYAAPAFAPLLILCTRYCTTDEVAASAPATAQRWYRRAAHVTCLQAVIMAVGLLLPVLVPPEFAGNYLPGLLAKGSTWMGDIYGWSALGRYLDSFGVKMNAQSPLVVIGPTYAQASLAMYHARNVEMSYALDAGTGRYGQQFVFWAPLKKMPIGCDAIIFRPGRPPHPEGMRNRLLKYFDRVEKVDLDADPRLRYFLVFRAYGYKGGLDPGQSK